VLSPAIATTKEADRHAVNARFNSNSNNASATSGGVLKILGVFLVTSK